LEKFLEIGIENGFFLHLKADVKQNITHRKCWTPKNFQELGSKSLLAFRENMVAKRNFVKKFWASNITTKIIILV